MSSTLNEVTLESARRCGAAFNSTCSAAGSTTTLIDAVARDQGTDENFGAGGWIYRPDAVLTADKLRRISNQGFAPATGTWSPTRAWINLPASAEAFQVYALLPPIDQSGMPESWLRLVNRALSAIWYDDTISVGGGDGTQNVLFPLADETGWTANEQHIKGVWLRQFDDDGIPIEIDMSRGGRFWKVVHTSDGAMLALSQPPFEGQEVRIQVLRSYAPLATDDDETNCPLTLLALRVRYELFRYLDGSPQGRGQYEGEVKIALGDWQAEYRQHRPAGGVVIL